MSNKNTSQNQAIQQNKNKVKLVWALVCLMGPAALFVLAVIAYAAINFALSMQVANGGSELFGQRSAGAIVASIMTFLIGALAALTFVPGLIIGIILLATRKQ